MKLKIAGGIVTRRIGRLLYRCNCLLLVERVLFGMGRSRSDFLPHVRAFLGASALFRLILAFGFGTVVAHGISSLLVRLRTGFRDSALRAQSKLHASTTPLTSTLTTLTAPHIAPFDMASDHASWPMLSP